MKKIKAKMWAITTGRIILCGTYLTKTEAIKSFVENDPDYKKGENIYKHFKKNRYYKAIKVEVRSL